MLRIIAGVLLVMWLLGFIGFSSAVGSFIHILLVLAIVMFVVDLISGGRTRVA
ncbi:MAG: lmo0937 family membrane protein [Abitibacteriaceae bacterium]|nr:lmo0937 family membrane protein [Abditibacteriaceae bacterium]